MELYKSVTFSHFYTLFLFSRARPCISFSSTEKNKMHLTPVSPKETPDVGFILL